MKIYTKSGDAGTTSLIGGKRVEKNHPKVEAYGDADELSSHIGMIIALLNKSNIPHPQGVELRKDLLRIQNVLMYVAAYFATSEEGTKKNIKEGDATEIEWLEERIDKMTEEMEPQKAFVIPAGPIQAAEAHIARTVCRRCERRSLSIEKNANIEFGRKYLNRLSDYLFTLSRYFCHITETPEEFWLP